MSSGVPGARDADGLDLAGQDELIAAGSVQGGGRLEYYVSEYDKSFIGRYR